MSEPEDLGAPRSYLVLADGTPAYDRSGAPAGHVAHVLADDQSDVFHGLILQTPDGHRFARADTIDGIYERGVIVSVPARDLPEPSPDATDDDESVTDSLRRAWDWLVRPH